MQCLSVHILSVILLVTPIFAQFNKPWETYKEEDDYDEDDKSTKMIEVGLHQWHQHVSENQKLLVVFYKEEDCLRCQAVLESMIDLLGQPELVDVTVGKSNDRQLMAKLGITDLPAIVLLRQKTHVFYDGDFELEDVVQWSLLAARARISLLDDDSFEHLTQASTGATTGDWLVAFYSQKCKDVLPLMETLAVRIQAKTNVAKVDIGRNYELANRFKIDDCPSIILFKKGKMFRYNLPMLDLPSLRNFVVAFHKNVKAENIPLPSTPLDDDDQESFSDSLTRVARDLFSDKLTENIAKSIKGAETTVLLGAGGAVLVLVVAACFCLRSSSKSKKKKRN